MTLLCWAGPLRHANAIDPLPPPPPVPSPTQPALIIPLPTPIPNPSAPGVEETIPVIIAYGDGSETHAQVVRGIMRPVGIPPSQAVTVTLFLTNAVPGTPVKVGLYDGGEIAAAASLPAPPQTGAPSLDSTTPAITVAADQSVRFNFQSTVTLGLYRVLLTVGPRQYLLQFFAVKPRQISQPPPPSPPPLRTPVVGGTPPHP
ncbi:MAG: hypothetical protein QOG12_1416 [Verrucomicrobiota bacterium]